MGGAFSKAVWASARLLLRHDRSLLSVALPESQCVRSRNGKFSLIPLSLWQQAAPVLQCTAEQDTRRERYRMRMQLMTLLETQQPTERCPVADGSLVVLSQLTWNRLHDLMSWLGTCTHQRFVLQATPLLQHLHLVLRSRDCKPPPFTPRASAALVAPGAGRDRALSARHPAYQ